jgi:hypothetical protein
VADLDKRGGYTPRRVREKRAYQLVVTSGVTGVAGVVTLILAVAGVIGAGLPIVLIIVSVICALMFRSMVRSR